MTIQQHAKKNRRRKKRTPIFVWLAAAVVLLIGGVLLYPAFFNDTAAPPVDDVEQEEKGAEGTDPNESDSPTDNQNVVEQPDLNAPETPVSNSDAEEEEMETMQIVELGSESSTILLEGMEDATTVYQYRIDPYGIEYEMDEFLNHAYVVEEDAVTYTPEYESVASVRLSVKENVALETVVEEMEQQFIAAYEDVSELEEPTDGDNPYDGYRQSAQSPQDDGTNSQVGYYVYQVEEHVLLIEYEYIAAAGDGVGPRLHTLISSVR